MQPKANDKTYKGWIKEKHIEQKGEHLMGKESKSHKATSNRIAKKLGTEYNSSDGVDINTPSVAVEVETEETVRDAARQLQGHRKKVYIAGTNQEAVNIALEATKGTTIGVMNNQGEIVKSSSRKKR